MFSETSWSLGSAAKRSGRWTRSSRDPDAVSPGNRPAFPLTVSPFPPSAQTHQLDPAAHYLRLRFLVEDRLQVYVPQPEEDLYELVGRRRPQALRGGREPHGRSRGWWPVRGSGFGTEGPRSVALRVPASPRGAAPPAVQGACARAPTGPDRGFVVPPSLPLARLGSQVATQTRWL